MKWGHFWVELSRLRWSSQMETGKKVILGWGNSMNSLLPKSVTLNFFKYRTYLISKGLSIPHNSYSTFSVYWQQNIRNKGQYEISHSITLICILLTTNATNIWNAAIYLCKWITSLQTVPSKHMDVWTLCNNCLSLYPGV